MSRAKTKPRPKPAKRKPAKRKKPATSGQPPRVVSQHERDVLEYCDDVLKKRVCAGELEIAAVKRFLADLKRAAGYGLQATGREAPFFFDYADANRTCDFVELLKHTTGEFDGQNFRLEPWQKFIFFNVFGFKRLDKSGRIVRRFREAFITMGRGNGKSPLAAAMLNRLLVLDEEARSQIKVAAVERDQAKIVFDEAALQLKTSDYLANACEFWKSSIVFKDQNSTIVPLGSEGDSKDGFNLHAFVADEIHAWKKEHTKLWSKLQTGMRKRRQPLQILITTAGDDQSHLWRGVHGLFRQVVTGVFQDDARFAFICEIDDADRATFFDRKEPLEFDAYCTLARKANPNLFVSINREEVYRDYLTAHHQPINRNDHLRYHLNVRVRSVEKPITPEMWAKGNGPLPDLTGLPCFSGLDLGWVNDLASMYHCFVLDERARASVRSTRGLAPGGSDGKPMYALVGTNWVPRLGERRERLTESPWREWLASGHLVATDGDATDPTEIYAQIKKDKLRYRIGAIALDPNNARAVGIHVFNDMNVPVELFAQKSEKFNEPIRDFLVALAEGRILHGGDPVLAWAADNLVLQKNRDNLRRPSKQEAEEKIDPIVAAIMAFALCLYQPKPAQPSITIL